MNFCLIKTPRRDFVAFFKSLIEYFTPLTLNKLTRVIARETSARSFLAHYDTYAPLNVNRKSRVISIIP